MFSILGLAMAELGLTERRIKAPEKVGQYTENRGRNDISHNYSCIFAIFPPILPSNVYI